jgi:hypothetical protein
MKDVRGCIVDNMKNTKNLMDSNRDFTVTIINT